MLLIFSISIGIYLSSFIADTYKVNFSIRDFIILLFEFFDNFLKFSTFLFIISKRFSLSYNDTQTLSSNKSSILISSFLLFFPLINLGASFKKIDNIFFGSSISSSSSSSSSSSASFFLVLF